MSDFQFSCFPHPHCITGGGRNGVEAFSGAASLGVAISREPQQERPVVTFLLCCFFFADVSRGYDPSAADASAADDG
jgi:hypothetical protein